MLSRTHTIVAGPLALLLMGGCPTQPPADTSTPAATTIHFDNSGAEAGITTRGASDFTIAGATFTGGQVGTQGRPPLYSSSIFAYEVETGTAEITLDPPADSLSFFYVHGGATPAGTATAFDALLYHSNNHYIIKDFGGVVSFGRWQSYWHDGWKSLHDCFETDLPINYGDCCTYFALGNPPYSNSNGGIHAAINHCLGSNFPRPPFGWRGLAAGWTNFNLSANNTRCPGYENED